MAKEKSDEQDVFDVDKVRELIQLMQEHDLNEVDLRQSDRRIKLRRGGEPAPMVGYAQPMPQAAGASASAAAAGPPKVDEDDSKFDFIKSPTVGTFYTRPRPDAEDFVKVGDVVQADTVVCLVEAMKMFNEIQAGVSGKIVSRLVNNEEPVDVNKPLFKIEPA